MPLTLKVTRGYTAVNGVAIDYDDLNAGFLPTIQVEGQIENADISSCAVTSDKVKPGAYFWGTATTPVSDNAIVITTTCGLASLATGAVIAFAAEATNTSTVTVNVDGLGVKDLKKYGTTALSAGDILNGAIYVIRYDGTNWQLISPTATTLDTNGGAGTVPTPPSGGEGEVTDLVLGNHLVTDQGTASGTALSAGGGDINVGSCTLNLPSGRTWTWVEVHFSTLLDSSAGNKAGVSDWKVKLTSTEQSSWLTNFKAWTMNNSDDSTRFNIVSQGVPTTMSSNLTINCFLELPDAASTPTAAALGIDNAAQGDVVASRILFAKGYCK